MATGTILLDPLGAFPTDGTGSGNVGAIATTFTSTGATGANTPKVTGFGWAFNSTTDQHICWSFRMPENYASGGTVKIECFTVTGQAAGAEVIWKSALAALTPANGENITSKGFPVPATGSAGFQSIAAGVIIACNLTLDSTALDAVAAGDHVVLFLGRDADHTMDDVTDDCVFVSGALEYTTA